MGTTIRISQKSALFLALVACCCDSEADLTHILELFLSPLSWPTGNAMMSLQNRLRDPDARHFEADVSELL
jgi:hypothetical protein